MSAADKVPCLPGRRKRRSRFTKPQLRTRKFYDIIQIAQLYEREGILCDANSEDENYEELASIELSIITATSLHGAKKIRKLTGIYCNRELWAFLRTCNGFRVFDETNFTKSYTSLREGGGTFRFDFLDAFVNGVDIASHEKTLQKRRKLDSISLQFTPTARDACVNMYFRAMTIIPTLCSFMNIYDNLNETIMLDIMERYLSPSWQSEEKQRKYHDTSYQVFLVDGWNMVNEIFKVQVQELVYWKENELLNILPEQTSPDSENNSGEDSRAKVTEAELKGKAHLFCHNILIEFFAWCSNVIKPQDIEEFWGRAVHAIDQMNDKMCKEMGALDQTTELPEETAIRVLRELSDGHPNMAEIRYDAATLTPTRRMAKPSGNWRWIPTSILRRCRWETSPVHHHYSTFLKSSEESGHDEGEGLPDVVQMEEEKAPDRSISSVQERPTEQGSLGATPASGQKRRRNCNAKETLECQASLVDQPRKRPKQSRGNDAPSSAHQHHFMNDGEESDDGDAGPAAKADIEPTFLPERSPAGGAAQSASTTAHEDITNNAIQNFYEIIVDWPILRLEDSPDFKVSNPRNNADMKAASNLINGDERWIEFFTKSRRRYIQRDVTHAADLKFFQEHWKNILCIEVRGLLSDRVSELLPTITSGKLPGLGNDWTKDIPQHKFLPTRVEKCDPVSGLFQLTCKSTSPSVNKRIAEELSGGSICFAYINSAEEGRGCSPLVLAICRRVSWDEDDVITPTSEIYEIELHLAVSRARVRSRGIWPGDQVYLYQVSPFSPYLRMFKSIQESYRLPEDIMNVLFGRKCPSPRLYTPRRQTEIDPSSVAYIDSVKQSGSLNNSQFRAVSMVMANIGECDRNSSSLSLIQGPPGTGKTFLLPIIVGAILSHSKVGHLQHPAINALKGFVKPDNIMRHTTNELGVRILICCPSNQAVDNCLEMFEKPGIPDGKGGIFNVEMVRLAKSRYNYGRLGNYSIDEKALPYDRFLFHREERERRTASSKAKKAYGRECLIAFCTNSTAGGDRLKSLKTSFDIIIQDEAGQALEPDTIIPATSAMRKSWLGRCHLILSGDPKQLPPVSTGLPLIQKVRRWLHFDYKEQVRSLFERLQVHKRAPVELLDQQYRMHPCIADMHSEIFYEGKVQSPLPSSRFKTSFNSGWSPRCEGLAPVTLIDTSKLGDRYEHNDRNGVIINIEEINVIAECLDVIKKLSGTEFHELQDRIALILPYRSQVDHAKRVLESYGKYRENGVSRQGFRLTVNTVDSIQGGERDIVIFAATRSNPLQEVGFLELPNRQNVAVSRARKLLLIIADISTMRACNSFERFWEYCSKGSNGSALVTFTDEKNSRLATLKLSQGTSHT